MPLLTDYATTNKLLHFVKWKAPRLYPRSRRTHSPQGKLACLWSFGPTNLGSVVVVAFLILGFWLLSIPPPKKLTLSSRWNLSNTVYHFSHEVSFGGSPYHCTRTICVGGVVVVSILWAKIESGSRIGWWLYAKGGTGMELGGRGSWYN